MSTPTRVKIIGGLYNGKVPDGAVYIGRALPGFKGSPFANPWCIKRQDQLPVAQRNHGEFVVRHGRNSSRIAGGFPTQESAARAAVNMFRAHLDDTPELRARAVTELRGKNLACWCKPGDPCHGDVLLEIANAGGES